jgi:hypothetical protein
MEIISTIKSVEFASTKMLYVVEAFFNVCQYKVVPHLLLNSSL